jgi:aspartate aminotransferase-like enzyme
MEIYLAPASATGFLEACVRCGVNRKMCGISNGSFGDRWQGIGTANGKLVDKIDVEWGKGVKPEHVKGKLMKDIEAVTFISNESSTGVFNHPTEICDAIRAESDALIFVDGVTSVGAVDLKIKKMAPDALVFGSQKALALPPGLAIICLQRTPDQEGRDGREPRLLLRPAGIQEVRGQGPAADHPAGLADVRSRLPAGQMAQGGHMPRRYQRHQELADVARGWAMKNFGLYAEQGYRSNTISVVESGRFDFATFDKKLKEKGFEISPGYGKVKDSSFRIGHMGDLTVKDMNDLVHVMDEVMEGMQ